MSDKVDPYAIIAAVIDWSSPRKSLSGHQSTRMINDEWFTPREILSKLGEFDLDPCTSERRPWDTAAKHLTIKDNGLLASWRGRVWLNPPFSGQAAKWLRRMRHHGNGIALVPARTETRMFYDNVWGHADAVLFIKRRPHFCYADGTKSKANCGAPIALIAYGLENAVVLRASELGFVCEARDHDR